MIDRQRHPFGVGVPIEVLKDQNCAVRGQEHQPLHQSRRIYRDIGSLQGQISHFDSDATGPLSFDVTRSVARTAMS
jgi:hypothetical protein